MNEIKNEVEWEIETVRVPTGYMELEVPTFKSGGYTVKIQQDQDAMCPREFSETITHLWVGEKCRRNYGLGDSDQADVSDEEIAEILKNEDVIYLPVYMLSHSGERLSTSDFGDRWDSGQIGFIYVSRSEVLQEWSDTHTDETIFGELRSEIREMDAWISGETYGYTITEDASGEEVDACWCYYGFDAVKDGALESLHWIVKQDR